MGLLDLIAVGLFVALLYRLRENHAARKENVDKTVGAAAAGRTSPAAGDGTPGQVAGERSTTAEDEVGKAQSALQIAATAGQDSTTVAVFVGLIACLVAPILFGRNTAETPGGALLDGDQVLWLSLESFADAAGTARSILAAPTVAHVVGVVDLAGQVDASAVGKMCEAFLDQIGLVAGPASLVSAALATTGANDLYGAAHLAIDDAVRRFSSASPASLRIHTVHGFGELSGPDPVKAQVADCLAGAELCAIVLEDSSPPASAKLNAHVRSVLAETSSALQESCSCPEVASRRRVSLNEPPESVSQRTHRETGLAAGVSGGADDRDEARGGGGLSIFKMFLVWPSRLLGFIYPFHQTYHSIRKREGRMGEWRAFWTLFAMIHFVEEVLFLGLTFMMVPFLFFKLLFIARCVFPDPTFSKSAYNALVLNVQTTLAMLGLRPQSSDKHHLD